MKVPLPELEQILERVKFGSTLHKETRRRLCEHLRGRSCGAGTVVYDQGDVADAFYVVLEGSVTATAQTDESGEELAARLSIGDCFGERALEEAESRRAATVRCSTDCRLLQLRRADFRATLASTPATGILDRISFLRQTLLFQSLDDAELTKVAPLLTEKQYPSHSVVLLLLGAAEAWAQVLVRQEEEIEEVLFVLRGAVQGVHALRRQKNGGRRLGQAEEKTGPPVYSRHDRAAVARRGAVGPEVVSQSRLVPTPPLKAQEPLPQSRLATLLSKHRRQIVGRDTPSSTARPFGVFEVTMAALRASKSNRPPVLTPSDLRALMHQSVLTLGDWRCVQIFQGGKYDSIGDVGLFKTQHHVMTVFCRIPTHCYVLNKFELLKALSAAAVAALERRRGAELDVQSLAEATSRREKWLRYRRRIVEMTTLMRP